MMKKAKKKPLARALGKGCVRGNKREESTTGSSIPQPRPGSSLEAGRVVRLPAAGWCGRGPGAALSWRKKHSPVGDPFRPLYLRAGSGCRRGMLAAPGREVIQPPRPARCIILDQASGIYYAVGSEKLTVRHEHLKTRAHHHNQKLNFPQVSGTREGREAVNSLGNTWGILRFREVPAMQEQFSSPSPRFSPTTTGQLPKLQTLGGGRHE